MTYSIRPLDADARTADFKCGELALDEYLQRYASQDIKRGIARVFVASPTQQLQVVSGFYTLSAASIAADTLPEKWRKKLPRYPVPIALLGRLAVWPWGSSTMDRGWAPSFLRMRANALLLPVKR